jgi:anti-sigma factor RsiW
MSTHSCSALDDYLAGDLVGGECARFIAHLPDCPACRRAVREAERIDALLMEAAGLETVPAELVGRVRNRLRIARRRRAAVVMTALAASIIAVCLINRPTPRPVDPSLPLARIELETSPPRPSQRARVSFPAGSGVAAVPVPTDSPNVTFLWLFPDRRPSLRPVQSYPNSLPERSSR